MARCTVVVTTRDRPHLLSTAIESALAQGKDTRVIVVDDGSEIPVTLPAHSRLTLVRHPRARGVAAARNLGTSLATTPLVSFLDDDDRLRLHMVARSLEALEGTDAPPPVAVVSGVAVLGGAASGEAAGRVADIRLPPSLRARGAHYSLEPIEPGRSYASKQSLVAPRNVLLAIGGFDQRLQSRVVTELFWRLNPTCSILGIPEVTYELVSHDGPRLSSDRRLRQRSFQQLVSMHRPLLAAHPEGHARLLAGHARNSLRAGQPISAANAVLHHARISPWLTVKAVGRAARR